MSEYISKEDALKALCSLCGWDFFACDLCAEYCAIDEVTPADVKPVVRGEWIKDPQTGLCVCSNCGKVAPYEAHADRIEYWPFLDFCPACGADMRERSETNERNL